MRTRLAVTWLIAIATLVVGAGVVGASSGYRRVAAQEDEVARLRTELESRGELVGTLSDKVTELNRTQGSLTLAVASADRQLEDLEEQYELEESRVEATIERYRAQFAAMDALVAQMNSTSSYLTQQFEAMSNSGK